MAEACQGWRHRRRRSPAVSLNLPPGGPFLQTAGSLKLGTSLELSLVPGRPPYTYEDLDEVAARFVEPMAAALRALVAHRKWCDIATWEGVKVRLRWCGGDGGSGGLLQGVCVCRETQGVAQWGARPARGGRSVRLWRQPPHLPSKHTHPPRVSPLGAAATVALSPPPRSHCRSTLRQRRRRRR